MSTPGQDLNGVTAAVFSLIRVLGFRPGPSAKAIASSFQASKTAFTNLLRLSDSEPRPAGVLSLGSPSTRLLLTLTRLWDANSMVEALLGQDSWLGTEASCLVLHLIVQRSRKTSGQGHQEAGAWWAHSFGVRASYVISNLPTRSSNWVSAVHLLRLIISIAWPEGNPPGGYHDLFRTITLRVQALAQRSQPSSAHRVAVLQLMPLFHDPNAPLPQTGSLGEAALSFLNSVLDIFRDEKELGAVRALALQVLSLISRPGTASFRELECVMPLCVEVLLWKTSWQHNLTDDEVSDVLQRLRYALTFSLYQTRFNIEMLRPHDDAYAILCNLPAETLVPLLQNKIIESERFTILEPLMALIVDQTAMNGRNWPEVFSSLIDAGLVTYFLNIASTPVSHPNDRPLWRSITDAFVGLMRCFEHMTEQQLLNTPPGVIETMGRAADDKSVPLIVSRSASDTRTAYRK